MNSNPFETWQVALPRRVATLARVEPLHRLEIAKSARNQDLKDHDLRTLALMVFDAVIEHMGLAAGVSRDEIVFALKPLIVAAEPEADADCIVEVAIAVLDFLLNESERRRAFCETVRVVEGAVQVLLSMHCQPSRSCSSNARSTSNASANNAKTSQNGSADHLSMRKSLQQ